MVMVIVVIVVLLLLLLFREVVAATCRCYVCPVWLSRQASSMSLGSDYERVKIEVLESLYMPKIFFDVRNDADAVFDKRPLSEDITTYVCKIYFACYICGKFIVTCCRMLYG